MNRRLTVLVAGCVLIAVIGFVIALPTFGITAASPAGTTTPHPATAPAPPGYTFGAPPTPNPNGSILGKGVSALIPSTTPTGASTPAFTAQDAVNYVNTHAAEVVESTTFTIVQAECLTAREIAAKYNLDMLANAPADQLNCIVQLRGDFSGNPVPGATATPIHTTYIIFDAHTGNWLMRAGRP